LPPEGPDKPEPEPETEAVIIYYDKLSESDEREVPFSILGVCFMLDLHALSTACC
jgi:hypothetical protein